jgi:tight adherence protein B
MLDPLELLLAGLIAVAILIIALSFAGPGPEAGVEDRVIRYGSGREDQGDREANRSSFAGRIGDSDAVSAFDRAVGQRPFGSNLARDIARADLQLKVSEFLLIWATSIVGIPALFLVFSPILHALGSPLALIVGAAIGVILPRSWLRRRESARLNAFNAQLPDTIVLIANALRSGSSFLQACELVVREDNQPIASEFNRVVREVNLGLPFETALDNMVRRIRSDDFDLMATAIAIQYQVGGNLAEILDIIASTIRERVRIQGEIRTLTAQQRLAGYIVGFLPLGLLAFLAVVVPNFLAPMFRKPPAIGEVPLGVVMLALAGLSMGFGFYLIRRIVDIDV